MMEVFQVFLGVWLFLFLLPLIPGAIEMLSNKPNRYRRADSIELDYHVSRFGFFTFLQPGRVKLIERGERFIGCIMAFDGHMFHGERDDNLFEPDDYQYWRVEPVPLDAVTSKKLYTDSHPIPFPMRRWSDVENNPLWLAYSPLSILWWIWKRWVYKVTGAVFTGIPPFQNVRAYPIERFKKVTNDTGVVTLERVHDYSDHYRVADSQYPLILPQADTRDKIQVKIILNAISRVFNPFLVAFYTDDDWTTRFQASVSNAVNAVTRSRSLDDVQSAADEAAARAFGEAIRNLTQEPVGAFGLHVERIEIIDITPTDENVAIKLGDLAVARVDKAADEERAKGQAAYIREQGEALKVHPHADEVVRAEALVRAAEAAGRNGTVILGGGSVDPIQAEILRELKRRNAGT